MEQHQGLNSPTLATGGQPLMSNLESLDQQPDELRVLILSCNNSSCLLDPVPTWLLKECINDLLPLVTAIVKKSITSGNFPESFKNAIVKPHLKNEKLDTEELKHYRPVSNRAGKNHDFFKKVMTCFIFLI